MTQPTAAFFRIGAFLALVAVALGAFGAHALRDFLADQETTGVWETAVRYHMWHALALLAVGQLPSASRARKAAGCCFASGIALFSGSLYALALNGPQWLGPVTPLGGLLLLAGWSILVCCGVRSQRNECSS